jgi:hypothetical protein
LQRHLEVALAVEVMEVVAVDMVEVSSLDLWQT